MPALDSKPQATLMTPYATGLTFGLTLPAAPWPWPWRLDPTMEPWT